MKRTLALATALVFASGAALAAHCPNDVKAIDAAMAKSPKLTADQSKEVKKLRDEGDAAHKAGKHQDATDSLHKAMKILGIEHEAKK
jgi:hypothetical protein